MNTTKPDELRDCPVIIHLTVQWGEMDAYQHVNNTVYFRYFESARVLYLQKIGFEDYSKHGGIGPILGHTQCKFLKPLTYPDEVIVGARTMELKEDRFIMELKLFSTKLQKLAAVGTADMVAFNYLEGRKATLPETIQSRIRELEGL